MNRRLSPWCKTVKKTLIDRDLSINDLATAVDMGRSYVSSIINGRVYSPVAVKKISDYLRISDADAELQD